MFDALLTLLCVSLLCVCVCAAGWLLHIAPVGSCLLCVFLCSFSSTSNHTPNFSVKADSEFGLTFKNKRDRKVINVDPNADCGDNSTRHVIKTKEYIQVVIYDHMTRRKS